jgi:hypothetical protein
LGKFGFAISHICNDFLPAKLEQASTNDVNQIGLFIGGQL